ncbi:MAG TPA: SigB/SigF/SigG family RNA polymerase sigma factor [Candidatus Pullichristensenella stercoripullorum]|nr:SigB/SigF/SigG family RNA polymerase sigma factor [Candidatus Pullichristensenella stercoripullorum]
MLLQSAREGDRQAREALVKENLPLVRHLVKRFQDRGREYDDLFQYGCLGLLKAIDRFDPAFGTAFSTYAVPVILGEIRRFLRDDGSIHVARSIKENARRVEEARQGMLQASGREPTVDELCEALDLEREDILLALNARQSVRSLDASIDADGELTLKDTLGTDCMEAVEKRLLLGSLLKALPREDMRLIALRYFQRRTQTEIAKEMGVSQAQVSRMESRILKRLREYAEIGL